jgi:hypothetical protein
LKISELITSLVLELKLYFVLDLLNKPEEFDATLFIEYVDK